MALTVRSNLIVPQILLDAIRSGFVGMKALVGTDCAQMIDTLPEDKRGGDTVTIPYFTAFADAQDVVEGNPLVPAALGMTDETSAVVHTGNAVSLTKWAELAAAYADPYKAAADMIVETVQRRLDAGLITAVTGAGLPAGQTIDISGVGSGKFDYSALVKAKFGFGDEQKDIAAFAMHSASVQNLYGLVDAQGRPLFLDAAQTGGLPQVLGVPVIVSDRMPFNAGTGVYTTAVIKKNALVCWYNGTPSVEVFQDVLLDSHIFAWHVYHTEYRWKVMPNFSKPGVVLLSHK